MDHKSLLQSDALYQYVLETSVYPCEPEPLKELRELTFKQPRHGMAIPPDEGRFLSLLLKLMNAKNTIEVGVYTGYSLLSTALALPSDGKIIAMDISRENYDLGRPIIEKAGVADKIDFREGPALPFLDEMLKDGVTHGSFDFAFVDADKENYLNYHKRLIDLVKIGGLIAFDNTLWGGSVAAPSEADIKEEYRYSRVAIMEFNKALAADPRIEIAQISIADGLTLHGMAIPPDEGRFLSLLLKLMNAKNTIEVGVYTGYSLLSTALALPSDGKIIAMDITRENYDLGRPIIEKAGVAHKIDFREGAALPALDEMLKDGETHGWFDFAFVDADKENYLNYHKRLIDLVKIGGLIAFDNTLWGGSVAAPSEADIKEEYRYSRVAIMEFNKALAADPRIEIAQISIADGLTLCRRLS